MDVKKISQASQRPEIESAGLRLGFDKAVWSRVLTAFGKQESEFTYISAELWRTALPATKHLHCRFEWRA